MIHNISKHCSRLITLSNQKAQIQKVLLNSYNKNMKPSYLANSIQFSFSQEVEKQVREKKVKTDAFSPIDYYRNTIRRVNMRSSERGRFSDYHLSKIVNMSKSEEHAKVMFEAYFNYLGHFTHIPNKVVDDLIFRAINIGNQVEQVLEIFANHNYLAYFPHYEATNRFLKHLIKIQNVQSLQKMIKILIRSPLAKINTKTIDILTHFYSSEESTDILKEAIVKLLVYRRNLTDGINQQDLLNKIAALIVLNKSGPFQNKVKITQSINKLLESSQTSAEDTVNRVIIASSFQLIEASGNCLAKEQQQIGAQYERYFQFISQLYQRSSQQVNYGQSLKDILSSSKLSLQNSTKLQEIINNVQSETSPEENVTQETAEQAK